MGSSPRVLRPDHVLAATRLLSTLMSKPSSIQELQLATNLPGATIRRLLKELPEVGFPVRRDNPSSRKGRPKQLFSLAGHDPAAVDRGKTAWKRSRSRTLAALRDSLRDRCDELAADVLEEVIRRGSGPEFLARLPQDTLAGLRRALHPHEAQALADLAERDEQLARKHARFMKMNAEFQEQFEKQLRKFGVTIDARMDAFLKTSREQGELLLRIAGADSIEEVRAYLWAAQGKFLVPKPKLPM